MSDGDRALDERLALKFGWTNRPHPQQGTYWCDPGGAYRGFDVPEYTGRDCLQLVEALQGEPHNCALELYFFSRLDEVCKGVQASVYLGNHTIPDGFGDADTPGLALGRAAEQALGGAER